jgi:hypothetical protein
MLPQGQIQSKPWLILSKSVAARNFYRQQKLDFRKVHRKEVHFALSLSAFAPFRLDVDPDEVGPKSSKIVDFSKFSDIENFEKTTIFMVLAKLRRDRYPSETGQMHWAKMQNVPPCDELSENPIFAAGRNFWR